MARRPKVVPNSAGIRELLRAPGVVAVLHAEAQPILSEAQRLAPVDTGAYKSSLRVEQATTDRIVVRVISRDPKALLIESRLGVLARAAGGKRRIASRERARVRRAERAYEKRVRAEESRSGF